MRAATSEGVVPGRPAAFRWRDVVTDVPRLVWAVCVVHVLALLCWSLVTPVYQAPDEPQHVDLVRGVAMDLSYFEYDSRQLSEQMVESFAAAGFSEARDPFERDRYRVIALDATPRGERPPFAELAADEPSEWPNPAPQHPPLYYALAALLVALLPEGLSFDAVVWSLRLLNVAMLAPVPLLAHAGMRRITGRPVVAVTGTVLLLGVPQYLHIGGAVNNDNLLTLQLAALFALLAWVLRGDLTRRTALWVGGIAGAALLTKGFALVLPVWVGSAYLVGMVRTRAWRAGVLAGAWAAGLAAVLGAWWWVRNVVVHGDVQTTLQRFPDANPGFEPTVSEWLGRVGGHFVDRFWGSFGWVDVTLSDQAVVGVAWTLLALVVLGVALRPRDARWWRADLVVALLPAVLILAVVAYGSYSNYAQSGRITGMQGRYLFPGNPGLALVAATGIATFLGVAARVLPALALGFIGWLQWTGFTVALYYWYGDGLQQSLRISMAAVRAWAPVPGLVTMGLFGLLALAILWLVVEALVLVRRPLPEQVAEDPVAGGHDTDATAAEGDEGAAAEDVSAEEPPAPLERSAGADPEVAASGDEAEDEAEAAQTPGGGGPR
jgi:small subunit ribosomal protein S36